jgi:PAS domain S-box-containing protein
MALNEDEEVVFVNKSFCKNFQYDIDELAGEKISDLFFFTAGRVLDAIESVRKLGEPVILRQVRLLAKNGVVIIADMKISRMTVHGVNQLILVMDDVTSKCRKDYQISLISQMSESIQKDSEIDRVLFSILTAVTSGAGLGFNRAMLYLLNEKKDRLVGKMGVGPDSTEEASEIWEDSDAFGISGVADEGVFNLSRGSNFYRKVMESSFPLSEENIFIQSLLNQENLHVHDAWKDNRVSEEICEFVDVSEFVVVPLVAGSKAIGVIVVDNKYNQSPIWQDNIELLSIFAVQAALSIESCNSLFILRDKMDKITSRQDAIVQTEKLAAVGRIAAHIAHEIRNPLITVGGYARRIKQLLNNPLKNNKSIGKSIEIVMREAERLEKILSNVMDFTRPLPYIREYNDINEVVTDTVEILKNVFQEKKIECKLKLKEDIPLIKSDFNQLKQVMMNLLQNAIDAIPDQGEIKILTKVSDDKVILCIQDTGEGIDEENIEHLFEPFYTTKVTGVGLGLAIVKKIINDHSGEISVKNRDKTGVEFRIEFTHSA